MVNYRNIDQIQEDKQIKAILGYPVKRTVRDKEGNIILNVGDIISFRALEEVKQADVLDSLFRSVYRK
ncbi:MAG: hypothetical protein VKN72_28255 [Nostocales cyanobacterium 94392]|nr:hypothetical protein [Nostocales cyanobacterium 94392]